MLSNVLTITTVHGEGGLDNEEMISSIKQNSCHSLRKPQSLGINTEMVVCNMNKISVGKKLDEWLPHEFNAHQKCRPLDVTCEENWILYDDDKV